MQSGCTAKISMAVGGVPVDLQTTKPDVVMAVTAPGVTFEGLNLNLEMAV